MVDIEAEARAIHKGKGEAWEHAERKLIEAWDSGDAMTIAAWQAVFRRYRTIANRARRDDGFYDLHIFMEAGRYASGFDPRPDPLTEEERAALDEDEAQFQAKLAAGLHQDPASARDPELDDDIPF